MADTRHSLRTVNMRMCMTMGGEWPRGVFPSTTMEETVRGELRTVQHKRTGRTTKKPAVAELAEAKKTLSRKGVAAKKVDKALAAMVDGGLLVVPKTTKVGTATRREYARGADSGPQEARGRMKMKVAEWLRHNLEVDHRGRRRLVVAREEAMSGALKTLRADGKQMGRWAVRAALLEVVMDERTIVEVGGGDGPHSLRKWVTTALQWAAGAGWLTAQQQTAVADQVGPYLQWVDPQAPVFLELGMGWAGLTDTARTIMKGHGGRVVTMDEEKCYLGERRGLTQPDIQGKFEGRGGNLIQHCSEMAKFAMGVLVGVFLSINCLEESKANTMPNGQGPHQGEKRTVKAQDAVTESLADLREWAEGGEGRFYMVEQPGGSALEGDPRVRWMGEPLRVRGCTYGLKHRKDYLLWTNLQEGKEFMVFNPKDYCLPCRMNTQHEQGMIPAKGSDQERVSLPGYSVKAARNRIPKEMGEAILEGFLLARQRPS